MEAAVADALRAVLSPFDLDEDTTASIQEIVLEAQAEDSAGGTRSLAKLLEEQLEPFLLAWGAEPTSIHGSAMQVAVSLRGLPNDGAAAPPPAPAAVPAAAVPAAKATAPAAKAPAPAASAKVPAVTLADFVSGGAKAGGAGGGYPKRAPAAKAGGAPMTAGALFAAQADLGDTARVWLAGAPGEGLGQENSDEEEASGQGPESDAARRAKERVASKQENRSRRLKESEAAVNALGAAEAREALGDIAAHGLRETRDLGFDGAAANSRKRAGRGLHVEGASGRNVHLEGVSITLAGEQGSKDILVDADLHLNAGHVYGLVGKNGSGKTTLLRRLVQNALPGFPQHLRVGYVAQELAALDGQMNAVEAVVDADEERKQLLRERDEIEALLAGAQDAAAIAAAESRAGRFGEIEERLTAIEADGAEDRAREALTWLSFDEAMMKRPVEELSGGWRMRIALARVLNSKPDVLLLDEPTNHLDLHGVLWLQEHLRREWGADSPKKDRIVVAVSHDRAFLDACATDMVEIHELKLRVFPGNYSNYVERVADEQRLVLLRKNEIEKEEKQAQKDLRTLKKKAREHADDKKVRQLKSKEKKVQQAFKLSSMREFGADGDDILTKLREDSSLRFRFPELEIFLDEANLLEIDNAVVQLGNKTTILKNVTLTLEARSRVAIVGGNGAGKSTLMRALAGELKFDEGPRGRGRQHPNWKPGFVSQNHLESQANHMHSNCVEYLRALLPDKNSVRGGDEVLTKQSDDSLLRAQLGNFGLGRDALKKVGYLSGGQRARLSLSTATWWGPTVLLLDEPTNHLDVDSLDALTVGLQAFEGPVVVVSHNRGFLEALCDELWIVKNGSVKVCPKGDAAFADFFSRYVKECKAAIK